jgi:hypothetical protein
MNTEKKQTAVTLLFQEFKALSEVMRKAGDEKNANLIDCLCEREEVAKQMEKEQIIEAAKKSCLDWGADKYSEQYYNETYGGQDESKLKTYEISSGHDIEEIDDAPENFDAEPIRITEEWLLKFGFKYDTDNDKLCKSLHIDILSFRASEGHMCLESQGYRTLYKHIKYVHQLQNLYFALTGEEITIGGNNE